MELVMIFIREWESNIIFLHLYFVVPCQLYSFLVRDAVGGTTLKLHIQFILYIFSTSSLLNR